MLSNDDLELLTALERSSVKPKFDSSNLERISNDALSTINTYNTVDNTSFDDEAQKNYFLCVAAFQICRKLKVGNSKKVQIRLLKWTNNIPPSPITLGINNELAVSALQLIINTRPSWALAYLGQVLTESKESAVWKIVLPGMIEITKTSEMQNLKEAIVQKSDECDNFLIWLIEFLKQIQKSEKIEAVRLIIEILPRRLDRLEPERRLKATKAYCQALSLFFERSPASTLDPLFIGKIGSIAQKMAEARPALIPQILSAATSILERAENFLFSHLTPSEVIASYQALLSAPKVPNAAKADFNAVIDKLFGTKSKNASSGIDPISAVGDLLWDLFDEYDNREDERITVSMRNLMQQLQLKRAGEEGEKTEYNPAIHSFIGQPRAGLVKIVKPGLSATRNGSQVNLRKAFVVSA